MSEQVIFSSLLLLIAANSVASIYIGSAIEYERMQKLIQLLLIWLIPILGFSFLSYFLWSQRSSARPGKLNKNNSNITESRAINHGYASNHSDGR